MSPAPRRVDRHTKTPRISARGVFTYALLRVALHAVDAECVWYTAHWWYLLELPYFLLEKTPQFSACGVFLMRSSYPCLSALSMCCANDAFTSSTVNVDKSASESVAGLTPVPIKRCA